MASSTLAPRTILDLPPEVLMQVFDYCIRAARPPPGTANYKTLNQSPYNAVDPIKTTLRRIRLTCRIFYSSSSHIPLVTSIKVELNASSTARFEEISRHPTISKGVQEIQVMLQFYDSVLADDLLVFASYAIPKLKAYLGGRKEYYYLRAGCSVDEWVAATQKAYSILDSWMRLAKRHPATKNDPQDIFHHSLLHRAHLKYRQRYLDQEDLRANAFIQLVATSMARMPKAKRLVFDEDCALHIIQEEQEQRSHWSRNWLEDDEALTEFLVQPRGWEDDENNFGNDITLARPPVAELINLPKAVARAGTKLETIKIYVSQPESWSWFSDLTANENSSFDSAADFFSLVEFCYAPYASRKGLPDQNSQELQHFATHLSSFLNIQSLREITLNFSNIGSVDLTLIVPALSGLQLSYVSISEAYISLANLRHLCSTCFKTCKTIRMRKFSLEGGTWADALDVLRAIPLKDFVARDMEQTHRAHYATYVRIMNAFSRYDSQGHYTYTSKVEDYVLGYISRNPLRQPWLKLTCTV